MTESAADLSGGEDAQEGVETRIAARALLRDQECHSTWTMTTISQLSSLQATLNAAINAFKAELALQNMPEPSLTSSEPHPLDDITYLPPPAMQEARRTALACLSSLKSLIQSPLDEVAGSSWAGLETASVRLSAEIGLSDILATADADKGMSVVDAAATADVDPLKLERILLLLVQHGWYRQPSTGHFANNRLSNMIKRFQPGWHIATYTNELVFRMGDKLPLQLAHPDPEWRFSSDSRKTAWNLAYSTALPYFGADGWIANHPVDAARWTPAMSAISGTSDFSVVADFKWSELARGKDAIVDVGGGQGTLCCSLAARYPDIAHFVVQDLPHARNNAEAHIKTNGMEGRVEFEVQDFFAPQQRRGKYLFVLQRVLHDWSNADCAKILGQIRDALNPGSALLIIDTLIQPGTLAPASSPRFEDSLVTLRTEHERAYTPVPPPPFIATDFGPASRLPHLVNVALTAMCNTGERTLPQMKEMIEMAGFRIKAVHPTRGWASIAEVTPV